MTFERYLHEVMIPLDGDPRCWSQPQSRSYWETRPSDEVFQWLKRRPIRYSWCHWMELTRPGVEACRGYKVVFQPASDALLFKLTFGGR